MRYLLLLFMFLVILQLNLISSDAIILCLKEGQTAEFSECNPNITDRTCSNAYGCKFCVSKSSSGAYCPLVINKCNAENPPCTYLTEDNPMENPDEENVIIEENNTNTEQNSNETTHIETNKDTKRIPPAEVEGQLRLTKRLEKKKEETSN